MCDVDKSYWRWALKGDEVLGNSSTLFWGKVTLSIAWFAMSRDQNTLVDWLRTREFYYPISWGFQ